MKNYNSWNNLPSRNLKREYFEYKNKQSLLNLNKKVIPRGLGRSYGDVCINDNGKLILTNKLNSILDFDIEKQFLSTNYEKLQRLAQNTGGSLFYPNQNQDLIQDLLGDDRFLPTRKNKQNVVSLIDFGLLLGLMVIALAAEWFLRKYNGLI